MIFNIQPVNLWKYLFLHCCIKYSKEHDFTGATTTTITTTFSTTTTATITTTTTGTSVHFLAYIDPTFLTLLPLWGSLKFYKKWDWIVFSPFTLRKYHFQHCCSKYFLKENYFSGTTFTTTTTTSTTTTTFTTGN